MNKNYFKKYKNIITQLLDNVTSTIDGRVSSANNSIEELCKVSRWCKKNKYPVFLLGDIDGTDSLIKVTFEFLAMLNYKAVFLNHPLPLNTVRGTIENFGNNGGLLIVNNATDLSQEVLNIAKKCKRFGMYIASIIKEDANSKLFEMSDICFQIPYEKKGPVMVMQFLLLQCYIDALAKEI